MKTKFGKHALMILAWLGFAGFAPAAYVEDDGARVSRPVEREIPSRRPVRANALAALVGRLEIGEPSSYRGLTVYPLLQTGRGADTDVRTLDEALSAGQLSIREKDAGEVPYVRVRNEGRRPVLLMAGEILVGGRQNRVIRDDVLLPARSEFVDIAVYCGEQNRWEGGGKVFKSGSTLTAPSLRAMGAAAAPQDHIWREIDTQLKQADVQTSTRSYQAVYEDRGVKARLEDCVRRVRVCRTRQTVGLVVLHDRRVLGADLFADADLCGRLWDKILHSYAGVMINQLREREEPDRESRDRYIPSGGREAVQRLLARLRAADLIRRDTPGLGRLYRLRDGLTGSALLADDEVVHAAVFNAGGEPLTPAPMWREGLEERTR